MIRENGKMTIRRQRGTQPPQHFTISQFPGIFAIPNTQHKKENAKWGGNPCHKEKVCEREKKFTFVLSERKRMCGRPLIKYKYSGSVTTYQSDHVKFASLKSTYVIISGRSLLQS